MKGFSNARFILLQPPALHKQGSGAAAGLSAFLGSHHRLWLIAFVSFFTFASLLTLLTTTSSRESHLLSSLAADTSTSTSIAAFTAQSSQSGLPMHVFDALTYYASTASLSNANGGRMADNEIQAIAAVLRRRSPCNLLVFGLGRESLLWRALNSGGRTVFVDENEYYLNRFEERHPGLEAYDVAYTTKVSELNDLLTAAREQVQGDCRPVQNLLFSECRLGINDLPNQLYEVSWDVILVDGPRGYAAASPGRMSAIFTASVMARSAASAGSTEVLVHDYEREVEKVCSEEFLCNENLVGATGQLAHFVIHRGGAAATAHGFCANRTAVAAGGSSL